MLPTGYSHPMRAILLALPLLSIGAAPPPGVAPQPLTLDRVFDSPSLSGPAPRLPRLSPDGRYATLLKPRTGDSERYDLWAIDTATGAQRMLVDSMKFGGGPISEEEKMRRERARVGGTKGIVDYEWAPDGKSILVPVDGDLYLATLDGAVRRLTDTKATEIDAHVSKSGGYVSFVRDQNLYAIDLRDGHERALTTEGKGTVTCGTAEFVAQEELDRRTGTWWGPGDARVAYECFDEAPVKPITRASIGAEGTTTYEQRYPLAGTPNVLASLWIAGADGGRRTRVDLGTDPDIYLARVDWAQDGKTLYVQRLSRDQHRLDLLKVDPATGASAVLFSEASKTWVPLTDAFHALKDGSIIWSSERDGYQHLYRWTGVYGRSSPTAPGWSATRSAWTRRRTASPSPPTPRRRSRTTSMRWITSTPARRSNSPRRAGGTRRRWMRRRPTCWSRDPTPISPRRSISQTPAAKGSAGSNATRSTRRTPFAPYAAAQRPTTFGTLNAKDGSTLHYRVTRPATPGPHPAFVEVYGGPAGQTVARRWSARGGVFEQYLARNGWVVFSIDGRGTPARGVAFERQIYQAMGTVEVEDQLTGLAWLKAQPFVDPKKVALFGWSNGGYMTLRMLEKAPHAYAAGVAVAPVTRWELYDTAYTERYMGDPRAVPAAYAAADLIADAPKIADPLLVMHGMADDNVFFDNSVQLVAKLQENKVPFEMMVYPGKTHSISGIAAQTHVYGTMLRFLQARLGVR